MGTIRHYGHRREIETLSSPLGRHFGETTLDLFKALLASLFNKNASSGEGCGYDHWQLQIIDKVDEGQPGQLGKRSANL